MTNQHLEIALENAAKDLIIMWGQAITRNEADEFKQEWGLAAASPSKKRPLDLDLAASAAVD